MSTDRKVLNRPGWVGGPDVKHIQEPIGTARSEERWAMRRPGGIVDLSLVCGNGHDRCLTVDRPLRMVSKSIGRVPHIALTILTVRSQLDVTKVSFWRLFHSTDMISAECSCHFRMGKPCRISKAAHSVVYESAPRARHRIIVHHRLRRQQ